MDLLDLHCLLHLPLNMNAVLVSQFLNGEAMDPLLWQAEFDLPQSKRLQKRRQQTTPPNTRMRSEPCQRIPTMHQKLGLTEKCPYVEGASLTFGYLMLDDTLPSRTIG